MGSGSGARRLERHRLGRGGLARARHEDESSLRPLVDQITGRAEKLARSVGCRSSFTCESYSPTRALRFRLIRRMTDVRLTAQLLDTGAGADAVVLAPFTPSAMLFVPEPQRVSHSPEEHAEAVDIDAGAQALASS